MRVLAGCLALVLIAVGGLAGCETIEQNPKTAIGAGVGAAGGAVAGGLIGRGCIWCYSGRICAIYRKACFGRQREERLGRNMDLKQFWSDLNNINPKNPGGWPWAVKIFSFTIILVGVLAFGYFMFWQDQWDTLVARQAEEEKLKQTFLEDKRKAINLDLIKKQLLDTKQSFSALLKQLPSKAEMDVLLSDINQAGLGRGLQFDLFKPDKEKPVKNVLMEQPISIKVEGDYDDLGKFASDVAQLSRIVILGDISISVAATAPGGSHALAMTATARTYRYIEETTAPAPGGARR